MKNVTSELCGKTNFRYVYFSFLQLHAREDMAEEVLIANQSFVAPVLQREDAMRVVPSTTTEEDEEHHEEEFMDTLGKHLQVEVARSEDQEEIANMCQFEEIVERSADVARRLEFVARQYNDSLQRASTVFDAATTMLKDYLERLPKVEERPKAMPIPIPIVQSQVSASADRMAQRINSDEQLKLQQQRRRQQRIVATKRKMAKKSAASRSAAGKKGMQKREKGASRFNFQEYLVKACGMLGKKIGTGELGKDI